MMVASNQARDEPPSRVQKIRPWGKDTPNNSAAEGKGEKKLGRSADGGTVFPFSSFFSENHCYVRASSTIRGRRVRMIFSKDRKLRISGVMKRGGGGGGPFIVAYYYSTLR